jgi:hypothetical protein
VHVHGVRLQFFLAVVGSCLKVSTSGCYFLKDTSWEIFASLFTWNVPVRLMTIGFILTSDFRVPCV